MRAAIRRHMGRLPGLGLAGILVALLGLAYPGAAQVVAVDSGVDEGGDRQTGHGFLIAHEGGCFVLMPRHVAAGQRRVTVSSAAPVITGTASVETPFWEGLDLAIGAVRGAIEERCEATIDTLTGAIRPELGAVPRLVRLRPNGEVEEPPMRTIGAPLYLTFDAEMVEQGDELFKGTSGAMLHVGGQPVGMVVETLSLTDGRFVRIEEVAMNASRWLDRRGGAFATETAPPPAVQASGMAVELVTASATPIAPETGPDALLGAGAYVFAPELPAQLVFRIVGEEAAPLSRVRLLSEPEAGQAIPRDVLIAVTTQAEPVALRPFGRTFRMGTDGVLEAQAGLTTARWVVVTILTAWDDGPVRVDDARFD